MKLLKTAGLLTVALVAAMAVFGAASAMAGNTQLCDTDPGADAVCPTGHAVTHVHFVDPLALLFGERFGVKIDILCEALFLGEALGLAAPQIVHGNFTFGPPHGTGTKCVNMETGNNCGTIQETSAGGLLLVLRTGDDEGTVTGDSFEVLVECAGLHCVYSAAGLTGTAKGALKGGNGNVAIANQTVTSTGGFLCPTTAKLTTTSTSLTEIHLAL